MKQQRAKRVSTILTNKTCDAFDAPAIKPLDATASPRYRIGFEPAKRISVELFKDLWSDYTHSAREHKSDLDPNFFQKAVQNSHLGGHFLRRWVHAILFKSIHLSGVSGLATTVIINMEYLFSTAGPTLALLWPTWSMWFTLKGKNSTQTRVAYTVRSVSRANL